VFACPGLLVTVHNCALSFCHIYALCQSHGRYEMPFLPGTLVAPSSIVFVKGLGPLWEREIWGSEHLLKICFANCGQIVTEPGWVAINRNANPVVPCQPHMTFLPPTWGVAPFHPKCRLSVCLFLNSIPVHRRPRLWFWFGKFSLEFFQTFQEERTSKLENVSGIIQLFFVAVHCCVPSGLYMANVILIPHGTHT